jgi:hypothetical protein
MTKVTLAMEETDGSAASDHFIFRMLKLRKKVQ